MIPASDSENPSPEFSQKSERSVLAPPAGPLNGLSAILWNERELRPGWRLGIYLFLFLALATSGILLTVFLHLPQVTPTSLTAPGLLVQDGVFFIAAFVAAIVMKLLEGRPIGTYGLPARSAFGARFWQGAIWGLAMIAAIVFLIGLLGGFSIDEQVLRGGPLLGYAALWGLVFLYVGLFEEFLFRGYTQFTLATGVGFWPAATMLSASFGALHLANGGEGPVGALSVFVIAMFFCLTLRRTGNLWFAVGLHASFDWGETFLFSVPNSGVVAPGHLLNSSFHGPVWLTGGTIGPEGSVMAFVVVALSSAIFSRVFPAQD